MASMGVQITTKGHAMFELTLAALVLATMVATLLGLVLTLKTHNTSKLYATEIYRGRK